MAKILEKFRGTTILVVEDNVVNLSVMTSLLSSLDITSLEATNGVEALDMYEANKQQIDIIFMDLHMPIMDGLRATKLLRERGVRIPILAITADITDTAKKQCRGLMNDYILKPVKKQILVEKIADSLTQKPPNLHFLVIEEESTNHKAAEILQKLYLCDVTTSLPSPSFSSSSLSSAHYDMVFVGFQSDEFGGVKVEELVKQLRAGCLKEDVSVCALVGEGDQAEDLYEAGVCDIILKPFIEDDFRKAIENAPNVLDNSFKETNNVY